jgi:hypothetical protein
MSTTVLYSITDTTYPTNTPEPTATLTITTTPTFRPTRTSNLQHEWVTDFAQPILDGITLRIPDFQDDFDNKSGGWQQPENNPCGQRVEIQDGELVLSDCRAHPANIDYADYVAEFDVRFLPDTNKHSTWQFIFRLYDAPFLPILLLIIMVQYLLLIY